MRFAAFHHETYLKYKSPMKAFLNREAEKYRYLSDEEARELKASFKNACQVIRSMFGAHAFKRFYMGTDAQHPSGYWEPKKFNASLFDILMYSFAREEKNILYQNLDSIREALIYLMTENQDFIDAIELSTSSVQAVTKRFDIWRLALKDVIGIASHEPRCFSRELKQSLFATNRGGKCIGGDQSSNIGWAARRLTKMRGWLIGFAIARAQGKKPSQRPSASN